MKTLSVMILAAVAAGPLALGCATTGRVEQVAMTSSGVPPDAVILVKGLA